jgi:hypothetical protein
LDREIANNCGTKLREHVSFRVPAAPSILIDSGNLAQHHTKHSVYGDDFFLKGSSLLIVIPTTVPQSTDSPAWGD